MTASLQWVTPFAEAQIAFMARGSNPPNQDNPEFRKLFEYCLLRKKKHWSPWQMVSMCVRVRTSLAVAKQFMRHWSIAVNEPMNIQETSMRYMDPFEHGWGFQEIEMRKASKRNRQSSEEPFEGEEGEAINGLVRSHLNSVREIQAELKRRGASDETVRMLYPQGTTTEFFAAGSARSWIHYLEQRRDFDAQLEHQELAEEIYARFSTNFPVTAQVVADERFYNPIR